jgi:hypothetical protein
MKNKDRKIKNNSRALCELIMVLDALFIFIDFTNIDKDIKRFSRSKITIPLKCSWDDIDYCGIEIDSLRYVRLSGRGGCKECDDPQNLYLNINKVRKNMVKSIYRRFFLYSEEISPSLTNGEANSLLENIWADSKVVPLLALELNAAKHYLPTDTVEANQCSFRRLHLLQNELEFVNVDILNCSAFKDVNDEYNKTFFSYLKANPGTLGKHDIDCKVYFFDGEKFHVKY